jgi:hypothetical protein
VVAENGRGVGEMEADIDLDFEDAAIPHIKPHQQTQQNHMDAIEMMLDSPRIATNPLPSASEPDMSESAATRRKVEEEGITASRWASKAGPSTASSVGARKRMASPSPPLALPSAAQVAVNGDAEGLNPTIEMPESSRQSWGRGGRR